MPQIWVRQGESLRHTMPPMAPGSQATNLRLEAQTNFSKSAHQLGRRDKPPTRASSVSPDQRSVTSSSTKSLAKAMAPRSQLACNSLNQKALHGWLKQAEPNSHHRARLGRAACARAEKSWTERITRPWLWQQWCQEHFKDQITLLLHQQTRKPHTGTCDCIFIARAATRQQISQLNGQLTAGNSQISQGSKCWIEVKRSISYLNRVANTQKTWFHKVKEELNQTSQR